MWVCLYEGGVGSIEKVSSEGCWKRLRIKKARATYIVPLHIHRYITGGVEAQIYIP